MDQFLREAREGGQAAEGGSFTLLLDRMIEKMRRYQSDEPALYFLKAVQAAVCLGAPEVDIRLGRRTVEILFQPRVEVELELDRLLIVQNPAPVVEHLASMLLAVLATDPQEASWHWCSGGVEQQWLWAGSEPVCTRQATSKPPAFRLSLKRRAVGLLERIIPLAGMLQIQSTLRQRCAFCPVPVLFDGRLVNQPEPERQSTLRSTLPLLAQLGQSAAWEAEKIWVRPETPHFRLAGYWSRRAGRLQLEKLAYPLVCSEFDGPHTTRLSFVEGLPGKWKVLERDEVSKWDRPHLLGYQTKREKVTHSDGSVTKFQRRSALVLWWKPPIAATPVDDKGDDRRPDPDGFPAQRWMAIPQAPSQTGVLIYVKAGVALDPIPSQVSAPGYACLWARDDAPTDLGQLRVRVEDSRVQGDLAWLAQQQTELLSLQARASSERDPKTFMPQFEALWNREYSLVMKDRYLAMSTACTVFHVRTLFDDPLSLHIDGALIVESGPRSLVPRHQLAAFSELSKVSLDWVEYWHERDWPAVDEPAQQIRLEIRSGNRFLRFKGGGYLKERRGYDFDELSRWCQELASLSGAQLSIKRGKDRMW